jgi:hypothetical protein
MICSPLPGFETLAGWEDAFVGMTLGSCSDDALKKYEPYNIGFCVD